MVSDHLHHRGRRGGVRQSRDGRQTQGAPRRRVDGRQDLEGRLDWNAWDAWAGVHRRDRPADGVCNHQRSGHLVRVRHRGGHDRKWAVRAGWNLEPAEHWKAEPPVPAGAEAEPNKPAAGRFAA